MRFLYFLMLFSSCLVFGQQKDMSWYEMDFFSNEIKQLLHNNQKKSFSKAFHFFKEKETDSTYVYCTRAIGESTGQIELDMLNYIQGLSASEKKNFKKALRNFLEILNTIEFKELELRKGFVYLNLEDYKNAISSLESYEVNPDRKQKNLKILYNNLGVCYIHTKEFVKSKEYFKKLYNLIQPTDTSAIINAKMNIANVYYEQYLDDEAIPLFKEAYDLAKQFSDFESKQHTSYNMAIVEKNRKRYKESIDYFLESMKLKDSLWSREHIWELSEKDKEMAVAQKQQQIAVQKAELKNQRTQRNALIFGVSGLLVFLGALGFFYKKLKSQYKLITKQKEALNTANRTKNYLFSVVSHDLRSPINTIEYQHEQLSEHIKNKDLSAIKVANHQALIVTQSTKHLLDNVLHWALEQSNQLLFKVQDVSLKQTVEHVLYGYKNLIKANNIQIHDEIENALVKADKESLKIVLRNIIDNAVKYGGNEIEVTTGVSLKGKGFIKVKDNGVGISLEKLEKINSLTDLSIDKIDRSQGVGLGVVLCHTLVKKSNGVLTFASDAKSGTTVTIELENVAI